MAIQVYGNGTAHLVETDASNTDLSGYDEANLNVSMRRLGWFNSWSNGVAAEAFNRTIGRVGAAGGSVYFRNSTGSLWIQPWQVNTTIESLEPGFFDHWSYQVECSVVCGMYPDLTLDKSTVL
jgi:hypothetical protein